MADQYKNDVDRIQRLLVSIKADLNKREQKKAQGQPVTMLDGEIRGQITNLDRELDLLATLIKNSEANLLQKEIEKRRNQLTDYRNQRQQLKDIFDKSVQQNKELFAQQRSANQQQLQNLSSTELYSNQQNLASDQDRLLDQAHERAVVLKYQGQGIGQTITTQNKQLDRLNIDVDNTNKQMSNTNTKLSKFVAASSNTCLLIVIAVEVIGIVLECILL